MREDGQWPRCRADRVARPACVGYRFAGDDWPVLDYLRSDADVVTSKLPVLAAHAEEGSRRRTDEGGADAFVAKPFQPNDFRQEVMNFSPSHASS